MGAGRREPRATTEPGTATPARASLGATLQSRWEAVFRYFRSRGWNKDDAQDLTQETFVRVFNSLGTFRHEGSLESWIFVIAANVGVSHLRRSSAAKRDGQLLQISEMESEPGDGGTPDPLARYLGQEAAVRLGEEIGALPPRMRQCLLLRYAQGRSYREIALVLGTSEETVRSQLYQVRRRLKRRLRPDLDVDL